MNLLLDNIIYSLQNSGGISVVWTEMLKRILIDKDFDVRIIEQNNENIFRKTFNIEKEYLISDPFKKYPLIVSRYMNYNKLPGTGIFHSSYYRTIKNSKYKNVTTVHDFTYEHYFNQFKRMIHGRQKEIALKKSDRIICVSENTKKDLLTFYPTISENIIKVINNGVNESFYVVGEGQYKLLKSLIPFPKKEYVLFIGDRFSKYKNFKLAINACAKANVALVIVGGGTLKKTETHLLNSVLGVNRFVHLKAIKNEVLNLILNYALCLLYPSEYEGFGIPIVEAQRAGCPVISTNYSSIPEVAGNGAMLVDKIDVETIKECINYLKNSKPSRESLIKDGLINSQRFSWDKTYNEVKSLYKEIF